MQSGNLAHLLDPSRKGYLLEKVLLTPRQFTEACRQGLKNHKGISLKLIEPTRDPLSVKVLRLEAPIELQESFTQAATRYEEARTLAAGFFDRWQDARNELAGFSSDMAGSTLTEAGAQRLRELTSKVEETEKSYRGIENCQAEARIEHLHAEQQLDRWARAESARRQEETRLAAEAAKIPKPVPLNERLSKLRKKNRQIILIRGLSVSSKSHSTRCKRPEASGLPLDSDRSISVGKGRSHSNSKKELLSLSRHVTKGIDGDSATQRLANARRF